MTRRRILPISLYLSDPVRSDVGADDHSVGHPSGLGSEVGRRVVLVGDSASAHRRLRQLRSAGAEVVHLSGVESAAGFTAEHCRGAFLVMAHTDEAGVDRHIAGIARGAGCLAYAHDQPRVSDFAMPAVARRGPLSIAVATQGTAPALARRVRQLMESMLDSTGARLDKFLDELIAARARLSSRERGAVLSRMAGRLRLVGALTIDGDEVDSTGDGDGEGGNH